MYRLLTLMGLAAIAILAVPQESAAQECDLCDYIDGEHRFIGEPSEGIGGCKNCDDDEVLTVVANMDLSGSG